jgi:hypothetical protein
MQIFLGVALILLFTACIWLALAGANDPPRLADPAPTAASSLTVNNMLPPQARGAYNPSANYLAIIAVVAPLSCVRHYSGCLAPVFHEAWLLSGAPKRKNAPELG